jgi:diguanylate cyclase (GGDEF)-like protein/PAS domain S-box-containing protein
MPRRGRRSARLVNVVVVPVLIALLGTLAVGAVAWRWHDDQYDSGRAEQAARVDRISRTTDLRLRGLRALTVASAQRWAPGASPAGTAEQWEAELAAGKGTEPSLIAVLYAERVRASDQADVGARFRSETGHSLSLEPGTDAVVLTRGAPATVLGYDLTDNPVITPVLDRGAAALTVATVDPALFGLATSDAAGPVVILAVPDRSPGGVLRGQAVVAFAGGGLAREVQDGGDAADGITIRTLGDRPMELGSVPAVGTPVAKPVARTLTALEPVEAQVIVTALADPSGRGAWAIAGAGALLSVLLGALLFTVSRSRDRAEAAVERATRELEDSQVRLEALVRHAADVITVVDAEGRITYVSPSVDEQFGYTAQQIVGRRVFDVDAADATRVALQEVGEVRPGETITRETVLHRRDGTPVNVRITVTNLLHDPAVRGFVANVHDITDHRAYEALLAQRAREDPLTGLPNRAHLDAVMAAARADDLALAVLFMDLDGFKAVNDELGHDAGDEVLRQLAKRLQGAVRPADTLIRLGGDEFVVVAPGCGPDGARALASRMHGVLAEPFPVDGQLASVGASIGVAVGSGTDDLAELLRQADVDMYREKLAGRSG